jgi:hypothetical protein
MREFEQKSVFWRVMVVLIVAFFALAGVLSGCYVPAAQPGQPGGIPGMGQGPNAQSGYSVPVYMEQGGAKLVVESTGAIEIQSGGALVVTPGATVSLGAVSQNGNLVVTGPTAIATATPAVLVNNLGAGNVIQEWRDAATPVVRINNNGLLNANAGIAVDTSAFTVADATGNTVISGTLSVTNTGTFRGAVAQTQVNVAGAGANPWDYTGTLGAMTSDTFELFDINLTNADHTGSNTLTVMDIANITGDAETTETGISVGTGWDNALDTNGTQIILGADGGVLLDETSDDDLDLTLGAAAGTFTVNTGNLRVGNGSPTQTQNGEDAYVESMLEVDGQLYMDGVNSAGAGANPFDYTGTLGAMTSDTFELFDVNITNADHTGSNILTVLDIANITGDAETTETGISVGTGWDNALDANGTQIILGADGGVLLDETTDDDLDLTLGAAAGTFTVNTGNLKVGAGSPTVAQDGEDAFFSSQVEIDGELQTDGAIDAKSNVNLSLVNAAGSGANPFDWSGTLGAMDDGADNFIAIDLNPTNADHSGGTATMLDIGGITGDNEATENAIAIGSGYDHDLNATTSLEVGVDGVSTVIIKDPAAADSNTTNNMFEVQGTTPVDTQNTNTHNGLVVDLAIGDSSAGTNNVRGLQVDGITGDAQVTETGLNIDSGWDVGIDVHGQPIILGADAGISLDESADGDLDLSMGAGTDTFTINTGSLRVGGGSPGEAQNGLDLFVADMAEVDGAAYFDGAVDMDSTLDVAGASTLRSDVTVSAASAGGNGALKNEITGLPRIKLVGGAQGTNPAGQTIDLVDDDPTGEYAPVDANVTEAEGSVGGIFKVGLSSYAATFDASAAEDDGFVDADLGAAGAWDDMESWGAFVYITTTVSSGDLQLVLTDDGGARKYSLPAVTAANTWTWIEVDINAGDLSSVSNVAITLTANGATNLGAFTIYLDEAWVWDALDEEALGTAIIQDGVLSVVDTEGGATLAEWTDYLVHYESGNDFIVYITNQSAADVIALLAY